MTLRETQLLIDEGIAPQGGKRLREIYETVNHHAALAVVEDMAKAGRGCGEVELAAVHRLVMEKIDDARAGQYRSERVMVTGAPLRPERVPEAMRELVEWVAASELHPVLCAGEAHYRFVKIHPFYDGNGRTGRLLMNWILLARGYPLTVIRAEERVRYITSLDEADRGRGNDFFVMLGECVERSLDQFLEE